MADRRCPRCERPFPASPPVGFRTLDVCSWCGTFVLVREMGEMVDREDRADPDDWGGSWT